MKKGDVVSFEIGVPTKIQRGKVNWVHEETAGITLLGPDFSGAEATVVQIEDCTVVVEYKGDALQEEIHNMKTEELKAHIQRLKGMRFPRKMKSRTKAPTTDRRRKLTKLLETIGDDPGALDALIKKALEEEEEK